MFDVFTFNKGRVFSTTIKLILCRFGDISKYKLTYHCFCGIYMDGKATHQTTGFHISPFLWDFLFYFIYYFVSSYYHIHSKCLSGIGFHNIKRKFKRTLLSKTSESLVWAIYQINRILDFSPHVTSHVIYIKRLHSELALSKAEKGTRRYFQCTSRMRSTPPVVCF